MSELLQAVQVGPHVHWVGAIDWAVRDFHGYQTPRGSTYNAYLVLADKITLIDTVKAPFQGELLQRISSIMDPSDIDYIVSNHSEMDHSGSLPQMIQAVQPEKVFASVMGTKTLADHFHMDREIIPVKDGETFSLGNMKLTFMETRMLHWPDSMFSYLDADELLFSQDMFGMHLASGERFTDELDAGVIDYEEAKYYANILLPFSGVVTKCLEKLSKTGWSIKTIAPDHGPIWRKDVKHPQELYARWAAQKPTRKAVIAYDTMWHSTERMAEAVAEGLIAGGSTVVMLPQRAGHRSDLSTEILEAGALIVGSPTINNTFFPSIADGLTYLKGLKRMNLIGAVFGSYGWSGEATKELVEWLKNMKVEVVEEPLSVRYVPDEQALMQCRRLGLRLAGKLKERVQA